MVTRRYLDPSVLPPGGGNEKKPRINLRILAVNFLIILVFGILVAQLWRLQVVEGLSFRHLADINRFRVSPVEAPRGIIYDRNHQILAANKPSFDVSIVPAALPKDDPGPVYAGLGKLIGMSPNEIAAAVKQRKGDDFTPVPVKRDVERDVIMRVEEAHLKLPGVIVVPESSRLYPFGSLTSHLLGYMLPITEEQIAEKQTTEKELGYRPDDRIGAAGVEYTYEQELRGRPGKKLYEVDATERPVSDIRVDNPDSGHNLTLSLDVELQRDVAKILQAGMLKSLYAVAIVMDPRNGQILAMVSIPAYDNNLFTGVVKDSDLQGLLNDPRKPMIDYSIAGAFPPGSTFKLVTGSGALQEGVANANTVINAPGYLLVPNQYNPAVTQRLPDWGAFGDINFVQALADSSDVYFYTLGGGTPKFPGLGADRLA
ncbi:MAG TPA: penicillin-binding transpeptidase domain-containing protein, partial [Chloroflexota bacterium]